MAASYQIRQRSVSCANHRRIRAASKRARKRGRVRKRPVRAELLQRMLVRLDDQARIFRTVVLRPDLRPSKEEPLLRRKAIDRSAAPVSPRASFQKRGVRDRHAAEIGDALAFHQLAVFVQARLDFVRVKLLGDAVAARLKILQVLGRPPVAQIALRRRIALPDRRSRASSRGRSRRRFRRN